jgi:hypothetical protein
MASQQPRALNYNAINVLEIGENEVLIQGNEQQLPLRRRVFGYSVFVAFFVCFFFGVLSLKPQVTRPLKPVVVAQGHWSSCANYSLAECCDCGPDQTLVLGQCWDGNTFKGMTTCARGCCLAGLTDTCNPVDMAIVVAVGAALGLSLAGLTMLAMGLGPLGPVAGGAFAGAQAAGAPSLRAPGWPSRNRRP